MKIVVEYDNNWCRITPVELAIPVCSFIRHKSVLDPASSWFLFLIARPSSHLSSTVIDLLPVRCHNFVLYTKERRDEVYMMNSSSVGTPSLLSNQYNQEEITDYWAIVGEISFFFSPPHQVKLNDECFILSIKQRNKIAERETQTNADTSHSFWFSSFLFAAVLSTMISMIFSQYRKRIYRVRLNV